MTRVGFQFYQLKTPNNIVIKINTSKHKSQLRISPKPSRFSKNVLSKNFSEIYQVYNHFYFKVLWSILKNITFLKILAQVGSFPNIRLTQKTVFRLCFFKSLPDHPEATDMFRIKSLFEVVKTPSSQDNNF